MASTDHDGILCCRRVHPSYTLPSDTKYIVLDRDRSDKLLKPLVTNLYTLGGALKSSLLQYLFEPSPLTLNAALSYTNGVLQTAK